MGRDDGERANRKIRRFFRRIRARGMAGALLFWGAIWAFTGFNPTLLPIFIGVALLMGFKWDADKKAGRDADDDWWSDGSRRRDEDWDDDEDEDDEDDLFGERRHRRSEARERAGQGAGDPSGPLGQSYPEVVPAGEPSSATPVRAAPKAPAGLHGKVIADAAPARAALASAAAVAAGELGERLRRINDTVDQIARALEADPSRLSDVQRVFTYYLPSAADLIAARGSLVAKGDAARVAEVDSMIGKLDVAFADFLKKVHGRDPRTIDIDIRLLEQALDQEFAGRKRD
jgi:hypothetical protein